MNNRQQKRSKILLLCTVNRSPELFPSTYFSHFFFSLLRLACDLTQIIAHERWISKLKSEKNESLKEEYLHYAHIFFPSKNEKNKCFVIFAFSSFVSIIPHKMQHSKQQRPLVRSDLNLDAKCSAMTLENSYLL